MCGYAELIPPLGGWKTVWDFFLVKTIVSRISFYSSYLNIGTVASVMKRLFSSRPQTRSPADPGDASTGQKKSTEKKKKYRYGLQQLAKGPVRPIVEYRPHLL